ncbi:hypothetical protein V6N11_071729 [Hibiscus sabdariffa]|uniref:Uncharacterized protein n=1 Tax=Hibiscus sabdariffa TaxID=183260 RepID=A0ABR2U1M7_9ROSI
MEIVKEIFTPISYFDKLPLPEPSTTFDIYKYRRLLGLLQHITITHLDISFSMNRLSQYMHGLSLAYWTTTKLILCYLKGTLCHDILFRSASSLHLTALADADWGGSSTDGRSTTR